MQPPLVVNFTLNKTVKSVLTDSLKCGTSGKKEIIGCESTKSRFLSTLAGNTPLRAGDS